MKNILSWLEVQLEWMKSFFSEVDGKASNKRLLSTLAVGAFLFAYVKTTLQTQKIEDIPTTWAFLILGILGINTFDWYIKLKNGNKE